MLPVIHNAFEVILDSKPCLKQYFGMCLSSGSECVVPSPALFPFYSFFLLTIEKNLQKQKRGSPTRFAEKRMH